MFELLMDGGWIYYIAVGVIGALFLMTLLFMLGVLDEPTVWHGLVFTFVAGLLVLIISHWTNVLMWVLVGLSGASWAGILFVIGCLAMTLGMVASYLKAGRLVS